MDSEAEQYIENAIKEAGLGTIGETEDDIIKFIEENDLINKAINATTLPGDLLEEIGDAVVTFTDEDTESPADIVIATDANGDKMGIGLGGKNGKVSTIIPGDKDIAVTAVDKTGDKHTEVTNVPKGGKTTIKGSTDEGKKAAEGITCELSPSSLLFDADGDIDVVTVITNAKFMKVSSNVSWMKVDTNGWNVFADVEENPWPEVRKGEISIGLSMDDKTILKTVTVSVTQEAAQVGDLSLSFIDKDKFMIQSIYTLGLFSWISDKVNFGIIYPENVMVDEVSEDTYKVTATYDNPMAYNYEEPAPSKLTLQDTRDYGLYYTVKFTIQAIYPTPLVDKNNFEITDIVINGYHKNYNNYAFWHGDITSDYYVEFSLSLSKVGLNWAEYDDGNSKQVHVSTTDMDGQSYTITAREKKWQYEDHGKYVKNSEGEDVWKPKYEIVSSNQTTTDGNIIFDMNIKWE